jgi:hypothetical protein
MARNRRTTVVTSLSSDKCISTHPFKQLFTYAVYEPPTPVEDHVVISDPNCLQIKLPPDRSNPSHADF